MNLCSVEIVAEAAEVEEEEIKFKETACQAMS